MRSDAVMFLFTAPHEVKQCPEERVSLHGERNNAVQSSGKNSEESGFRELYERISEENRSARKSACSNEPKYDHSSEIRCDLRREEKEVSEGVNGYKPGMYCSEAAKLVKDALISLSNVLGMKIDESFHELPIEFFSEAAGEQFREILFVLRQILSVLENPTGETAFMLQGKRMINADEIGELAATVRNEKFRIELGLGIMGLGGDLKPNSVSESGVLPASGIPQALNPADLVMPETEIRRLFGDFTPVALKDGLVAAVNRIKALIKDVPDCAVSVKVENPSELQSPLDSKIMRAILKIDSEVNNSAANETVKLPDVADFTAAAANSDIGGEGEEIQHLFSTGQAEAALHSEHSLKIESVFSRITDDSFVTHIAERIQHALRTGVHELRIQLRPEALGEVKLSIRMEGDVVFARIQVENMQVKQIVECNLQALKDALEEHSIQTGTLDVDIGGEGGSGEADRLRYLTTDGSLRKMSDIESSEEDIQIGNSFVQGVDTGRRYGNNSFEYFA